LIFFAMAVPERSIAPAVIKTSFFRVILLRFSNHRTLKFVKHTFASLANTKPMWEYTFKNDFSQILFVKNAIFRVKITQV